MLRDLMRPFDNNLPDYVKGTLTSFCLKLYNALLELEDDEQITTIPIEENEALLINQKVGNEDWGGALRVLSQTWAVLYEYDNPVSPVVGRDIIELLNGNKDANGKPPIPA